MKDKLNRAQAQAIFEEKAVLIGSRDVVPEEAVAELFGEDAVAFTRSLPESNRFCNGYGVGDYTFRYFTLSGFFIAVTYRNICKLRMERKSAEGDQ